ncbi:MAG: phage minor capsid protein [Oscillospiraceae bacterium]|nr:phage minor capsid protein [Oscillospiraceae bacterium]
MLTPNQIDKLPEPVVELMSKLQDEIISDICRRITKANYLTPTAEWQLYKANQLTISAREVKRRIAAKLKVQESTLKEIYTDAVKTAIREDELIYKAAISEGIISDNYRDKLTNYTRSKAFSDVLKCGLKNTNGLMRNLTNSAAAAANRQLSDALDLAYLKCASGAFSPQEAIFEAVKQLGADGLKCVSYESGRTDQLDVAVRRAVVTGIGKTCCDMQLELANEMECELVEVSSHLGARPSHAEWQGQIYSLKKGHPKYPYFYDATGYGTGDGLGGWNCRHSFFPYFDGLSTAANAPTFSKAENLEEYKNTQKQRAYERSIRKSKRELSALDGARSATEDPVLKAKLDREFERKSVTLKNREARLAEHLKTAGLLPDNSRVRVDGFGKSVSQKAYYTANKSYTKYMHQLGIENPPKTIALFNEMMYNNTPEYQLMNKYMNSVKSGMLSPLAGYEKYKEYHERIEKEIIGMNTSNGIEIKSQSNHFLERVFGTSKDPHTGKKRDGVPLEEIQNTLSQGTAQSPKKCYDKDGNVLYNPDGSVMYSQKFVGEHCEVSINPDTGRLIQTNPI